MADHKRLADTRDIQFRKPTWACFACHDTGLLANSDGLIGEYLPDYDRTSTGQRCGGHDLALVCWCTAAYRELGPDGQLVRGGYREDSGEVRKVQTSAGLQLVGASLPKHVTRELHTKRRERWLEAEKAMTQARRDGESPWFIAESKAALEALPGASGGTVGGLQSLGSILGGQKPSF